MDTGESAHQRRAVEPLEFVEDAAVHQPRDDFPRVDGLADVFRDQPVEVFRRIERRRRVGRRGRARRGREIGDDAPHDGEGVAVVAREMIDDSRNPRMDLGAAEVLGRHALAGGGAHQRRAAEKDRPLPLDDDRLVGHGGNIGAAGGATAHDRGDLRDPGGGHGGLIVEDAPEMLAVGKHFVLRRQVGAAGIDEIDARQAVLARDFLRPQMLLDRHGKVGPALDGRVVGDDDAFAPLDPAHAGDDSRPGRVVVIHAQRGELREFEKRRSGVQEQTRARARRELAAGGVAFARVRAATLGGRGDTGAQVRHKRARAPCVLPEFRRPRIQRAAQHRHVSPAFSSPRPRPVYRLRRGAPSREAEFAGGVRVSNYSAGPGIVNAIALPVKNPRLDFSFDMR